MIGTGFLDSLSGSGTGFWFGTSSVFLGTLLPHQNFLQRVIREFKGDPQRQYLKAGAGGLELFLLLGD